MQSDSSITFRSLNLAEPLLRALADKAYSHPSPIQAQAIPHLLAGRDVLGCAQTGTGKTAAFALPILQRLAANPRPPIPREPRVLILTPTRELAAQIGDNIALYGRHLNIRHTVIFGGVGANPQVEALRRGVDIVVATPGRLLDLKSQRHIDLGRVEVFVLDEADRMLDMGFAPDVKRVIADLPYKRQSLLFSATMPKEIRAIADKLLRDPAYVAVTPVASTVDKVEQRVCHVHHADKLRLLVHLLDEHREGLVLVFSRTKHGANRLVDRLDRSGIPAAAIHGNKSQGARTRALEEFRSGDTRVLVATDIAARGIDVKGISLVVNFDLPVEPEAYVHRIGRTARAGAGGTAISLCDPTERESLHDIQRLIRQEIAVLDNHPFAGSVSVPAETPRRTSPRPGPGASGSGGPRSHNPRQGQPRRPHSPSGSRRPSERGSDREGGAAPTAAAAAQPAARNPVSRLFSRLRPGRR